MKKHYYNIRDDEWSELYASEKLSKVIGNEATMQNKLIKDRRIMQDEAPHTGYGPGLTLKLEKQEVKDLQNSKGIVPMG